MQNRHPLEQELHLLLKDEPKDKADRAIKLEKILTCFKISNDNYHGQVLKYHQVLTTYNYKLFDLSTLKGADINAHTSDGHTALILALHNEDEDSALTLLNANANPNDNTPNGDTPLLCAARRNLTKSVSHLLKKGVDVNAKRKFDGATALIMAASWGYTDLVAFLLNAGADHTVIFTRLEWTALDWAVEGGFANLTIIKLLLEKDAAIRNPSRMQRFLMSQDQNDEAVKYCYSKLTQYSISSTPNTSTQDKHLTITDITSRIQLKIKESRSNDKGFSSLFRDVDFSAKQIKIAEELIIRLNNISTQSTSDQLKTKIASEFETALNAFAILLAEKNNINRVNTKALGSDLRKSMAGTRFHSTILSLAKEISNSNITQINGLTRGGITLFEPSSLNDASRSEANDRVSSSIGNNNL